MVKDNMSFFAAAEAASTLTMFNDAVVETLRVAKTHELIPEALANTVRQSVERKKDEKARGVEPTPDKEAADRIATALFKVAESTPGVTVDDVAAAFADSVKFAAKRERRRHLKPEQSTILSR